MPPGTTPNGIGLKNFSHMMTGISRHGKRIFCMILAIYEFHAFCKDIHETITMVRAEKERKTGSSNRKSRIGQSGPTTSRVDSLPKMLPTSPSSSPIASTPGTSLISISETSEDRPHPQEGGKEIRKDEFKSSTYTKEITAVVEDLELAPKRRSVTPFPLSFKSTALYYRF